MVRYISWMFPLVWMAGTGSKFKNGAEHPWSYTKGDSIQDSVKTVDLTGKTARYVKLNVVESNGKFFASNGLYVYKADGSKGFAVGK